MPQDDALIISAIQHHPLLQIPKSQDHDHPLKAQLSPLPQAQSFPEGGLQAWLVVAGSFCVIAGSFGFQSSIGIFQSYWLTHQLSSYSSSEVGWISAVNIFLTLFLGVQIGPMFDRWGPRWLLLSGSVAWVACLAVMAQCETYWEFMLLFGIVGGVAEALLTTTGVAVIAHWFEAKRGQANGVVFIGSSLGGITIPLIMRPLLDKLGWAWTMRVLALGIMILMLIGNVLIRGRLPKGTRSGAVDLKCFLDSRFTWATIGIAGSEFVLFGVLGLLPTWALEQGFDSQTSFNILAVLNGGSAFGRFAAGWLSDSFGRLNTMVITTAFAVAAIYGTWLPISFTHSLPLLYFFSAVFGFGSGSIISLAPVCFGQLCKANDYGRYYGTAYSVVSFAYVAPFSIVIHHLHLLEDGEDLADNDGRTFICIPVGGALSPVVLAAVFGGIVALAFLSFMMARWACLEYRWIWFVNI